MVGGATVTLLGGLSRERDQDHRPLEDTGAESEVHEADLVLEVGIEESVVEGGDIHEALLVRDREKGKRTGTTPLLLIPCNQMIETTLKRMAMIRKRMRGTNKVEVIIPQNLVTKEDTNHAGGDLQKETKDEDIVTRGHLRLEERGDLIDVGGHPVHQTLEVEDEEAMIENIRERKNERVSGHDIVIVPRAALRMRIRRTRSEVVGERVEEEGEGEGEGRERNAHLRGRKRMCLELLNSPMRC